MIAAVLALAACGEQSTTSPDAAAAAGFAGDYLGEAAIENVGYFSNAALAIDSAGRVTGMLTSKSPSNVPAGEVGSVDGMTSVDKFGFMSLDVTVESASLGRYSLTGGTGQIGTVAGRTQFGVSGFTINDANGTFVGTGGIITANKQ
jgi:hypothetical protein